MDAVPPKNRPLPEGWRWVKLGEVCEVNPSRPKDFKLNDDSPITFVPMSAVDEIPGVIANPVKRTFAQVRKGYTYFAEGDVLFAKITPCMQNGKHAIARDLINGIGFGTTEFHILRPGSVIIAEWIHSFIRQPWILKEAEANFTGSAGQQRVPKEFLLNLDLPLPPLAEQRRIAAILKEQMGLVERARCAVEEQLEAAQALPAAYLRQVFPRKDQPLPEGWRWVRLGEVVEVVNGFGFREDLQGRNGLSFPFIKVSDMNARGSETIVRNAANTVDRAILQLLGAKTYPVGTVIFPKVGGALLTNKKRILGVEATFDNNVMGIVPRDVESEWVFLRCSPKIRPVVKLRK